MKQRSYSFDRFNLLPSERRLVDRKTREDVRISGKPFEVLVVLVENFDRLVRRNELIKMIWGDDADIESGNVDTHVSHLRRIFGDDDDPPRFIATVWGLGFRFVMPVKIQEEGFEEPRSYRPVITNNQTAFEAESHKF